MLVQRAEKSLQKLDKSITTKYCFSEFLYEETKVESTPQSYREEEKLENKRSSRIYGCKYELTPLPPFLSVLIFPQEGRD